ncbi:MAG: ATP-dependent Clp protease adaptor ClpS [Bacteroidota bacterium]
MQIRTEGSLHSMINFAESEIMEVGIEIREEIAVSGDIGEDSARDLMVYNDDFNTFDHVINTLIKVCKHEVQQAEQCTYLIHYKGKCSVKKGDYEELKPMREGISSAGIKAAIV